MKTNLLNPLFFSLLLSTVLSSCVTTKPGGEVETVRLTWDVPKLVPLQQTPSVQEKGGLWMSLVPPLYSTERRTRTEDIPTKGPLGGLWTTPNIKYFDRREIPYAVVTPGQLRFTLTVNNKLDHLFRGAGSLVSLNVAGNTTALDQSGYAELLNLILPPRAQNQINIVGPSLESLPPQGTIGVFVYDVVTQVDAAGNPTKRENFEWYFDYSTHAVSKVDTVKVTSMQQKVG